MRFAGKLALVLALGGLLIVGAVVFVIQNPEVDPQVDDGTEANPNSADALYVNSASCRECHPQQHDSWHATWHRTMTQQASRDTVAAPFDNVRLSTHGKTIQLSRKGDLFFVTRINTEGDEETPGESQPIVMTTGSHLMQTYWVQIGSELRQLPWFFHIEEQMWIPAADTFLNPPPGEQNSGRWNDHCIKCHTTGAVPGYNGEVFKTNIAEMGIACEACHGPGDKHVAWHQSPRKDKSTSSDAALINPGKIPHDLASQICGQCHSSSQPRDRRRWLAMGSQYRPGENHANYFRHATIGSTVKEDAEYLKDSFWDDGACRVGGDEYLGLADSACFQRGEMSCMTCHSMHDSDPTDQLRASATGNEACFSCHAEYRENLEQHTHHSVGSSGSECYNCHMPHTSFALFKAIRSHRVDIPRTENSTVGSRPNACNLDQPLQWTATKLTEWYCTPDVEMDETDITTSAAVLWLLRGNAMQRVVTAWNMGWQPARDASGSDWQTPFLAEALTDPYSVIRFVAWRSLKQIPGFEFFPYNFLESESARFKSRDRAVEQWQKDVVESRRAKRILLTPDGNLERGVMQQLQIDRDDRVIEIFE